MNQLRHTKWKLAQNLSYQAYVFSFSCVVQKSTAHVDTKALNMHHQSQNVFCGIFVGIPQHQKGYLVYVPSTQKIISSYDVVFDKAFSNALAYTSRPYSKALDMRPSVSYIQYVASSHEQTGEIITCEKFEEGYLE